MKSKELMTLIQTKKDEARSLMDKNDMAGARAIMDEVRGLDADLKTALEIEEDELRSLRDKGVAIPVKGEIDEKRSFTKEDEMRSLGKHVLGMKLNDEERALVTVADNGALLPQGYVNELMVLRKGYPALKPYCHVIPVTTKTGKMPVATLGNNKLAKLSSNQPIGEGAVNTDQVIFDVEDYGKFVPVENSLTDDEVVGIISSVLMPDFAEGSIEVENEEILSLIKAKAVAVTGTDYDAIENAMDTLVPACRGGLITITNTAGYSYLKNKKDKIGRNLNLIKDVNGVKMFNDKPIVELADDVVTASEGKLVYYIVNLREAVKFFDRKGIVITKSSEFLFNKNQDCLRAIERFDTQEGSMRSCKKIEIPKGGTVEALEVDFQEIEDAEIQA